MLLRRYEREENFTYKVGELSKNEVERRLRKENRRLLK
jgi:hypothetical protein